MSIICNMLGHKFSMAEIAGMRISQTFHGNSWTPVGPKRAYAYVEETCSRCGLLRTKDFLVPMKDIEWAIAEVNRGGS